MEKNGKRKASAVIATAVLFCLLALSGTVSADPYLGGVPLATVEEGVVSGDLWFDHANPMATDWTKDYILPSYSDVEWARLYVVVYCGHMQNNYSGRSNITFNGVQLGGTPDSLSSEDFNVSYSFPGEGGIGPVWVNDHCVRVTSDYLMWYDVTGRVQPTSNVWVKTWPTSLSFDGRIKGVTLIVAYNDGDYDTIHYWVNQGHDTDSYLYGGDYIGETNFTADLPSGSAIQTANLTVVHVASSDGLYTFNGVSIPTNPGSSTTPPGENWQGSSSGYNIWYVPALINSTGNNTLTYDRTGNYYKIIQAFLTANYTIAKQPDLNVTAIKVNPDYSTGHKELFVNESNTITATIKNLAPTNNSNAFTVCFEIEGVDTWRVPVDGLAAGASTDVSINWTPSKGGTVLSPVYYNVTVTADCDGEVSETDETNNATLKQLKVYNNGYKGKRYTGGRDLETKQMEPIRGNLIYSKGDSVYQSGGTWTSYTVNWTSGDLPVPGGASVKQARLYVYYTWDPSAAGITASMNFNGQLYSMDDLDAHYKDAKGYGSYSDHKYGTMVYNVKNYFNTGGNTAILTKVVTNNDVALYGMLLVVIYENSSELQRLIWLNEECDLLAAKPGYGTNETEATAYAPFTGTIELSRVDAATLITVVPGGDSGVGQEDRLYFNSGQWDNVWNGAGAIGQTISINETDVKGSLLSSNNLVSIQSRGDSFIATNAFLVVKYKEEAPGPQSWYLTGDPKPTEAPPANDSVTHDKDNLMNRSAGVGTWNGTSFELDAGKPAWFYADTGAQCALGFGEKNWTAHIRTESIEGGEIGSILEVSICKLAPDGGITFLANGSQTLTAAGAKKLWNITCVDQDTTQDFSAGEWLALRVLWQNETADTLTIYYKNESGSEFYIESPSSDPGYPIPEISTLFLFGMGLLVLAGYILLPTTRK